MKSRRNETVSLLKSLVKIDSVNPFDDRGGGEAEIAEFIRATLDSYGLATRLQRVKGRRANVVGLLRGTGNGPALMLNGHIDTVGVSGVKDPFGGRIDGQGLLHGRGACDMKGSIASMLTAIKSVVDSGTRLRGDLVFAGVVDEEYLSLGTRALVREYRTDAAIVGEPTGMDVAIAHKGYDWVEVTIRGRAAHGSVPEKGIDAIEKASTLVASLSSLKSVHAALKHPLVGSPRMHTSTIAGGTEWSVVPESCTLHLERRTLPGERKGVAKREVQRLVDNLSAEDPEFHATVAELFHQSGLETSSKEPIVRSLGAAYRSVTGRRAKMVGMPYWTDAALLSGEAGIPACLFGPGDIRQAHSADEYVDVKDVEDATLVFERAIRGFCLSDAK
ncbi:MAG: ArgE/DapE family deacylase [Nitrososphaerota archaeon]|nr:ArgE/DapE family deacylase [Nitrososphaerota archaeon]